MPNLGTWRGEGGARAPAAGGGRGSRCPAGEVRRAGGGAEGFRGAPAPKPSPAPEASPPAAPSPSVAQGVPRPLPEGCGAPARPRGVRARPRRSPAAPRPRTTRRAARPRRRASRRHRPHPGRDRPVGLAHLNLDLRRGTGAASPERAFSNACATAGWGERARRELQQVSLAQPSVPCPGTAVICAPHRTQLSSSPPSRPALAAARLFQPGAGSGADPGGTTPPTRTASPAPARPRS